MVEGRNFHLTMDGTPKRLGFYAPRLVEASPSENAAREAATLVWESFRSTTLLNRPDDGPNLAVGEITRVPDSATD